MTTKEIQLIEKLIEVKIEQSTEWHKEQRMKIKSEIYEIKKELEKGGGK